MKPIDIIPPVNRARGLSQNSSLADLKKENSIAFLFNKIFINNLNNKLIFFIEFNDENHDLKYIWCTLCRHGGHIEHIREWFEELMVCPVADCNCMCLEYNHFMI